MSKKVSFCLVGCVLSLFACNSAVESFKPQGSNQSKTNLRSMVVLVDSEVVTVSSREGWGEFGAAGWYGPQLDSFHDKTWQVGKIGAYMQMSANNFVSNVTDLSSPDSPPAYISLYVFRGPNGNPWDSYAQYSTYPDIANDKNYIRPSNGEVTWVQNPYTLDWGWMEYPVNIKLRNLTLLRTDSKGTNSGEQWPETITITEAEFIKYK